MTQEDKDWMNGSAGPIKSRDIFTPKPDGSAENEPSAKNFANLVAINNTNIDRIEQLQDIIDRQAEQIEAKDLAIMAVKDWLKDTVVPTKGQLTAIQTLDKALETGN